MLLLTERDVRDLLSMDDLIDAMRGALAEFSCGRVQQPLRTVLETDGSFAVVGKSDAPLSAIESVPRPAGMTRSIRDSAPR